MSEKQKGRLFRAVEFAVRSFLVLVLIALVVGVAIGFFKDRIDKWKENASSSEETSRVANKSISEPQEWVLEDDGSPNMTEGGGGILYGENHAYAIKAPMGWIFDNLSGVKQGLHAVIYPKGKTWDNSPVIMYTSVYMKGKNGTFHDAIKDSDDDYKAHSPNLKIENYREFTINKGGNLKYSVIAKKYSGDKWGNTELIAFIDAESHVVLVVLNSKDEEIFNASVDAFMEVVESFMFLTDKVRIEEGK